MELKEEDWRIEVAEVLVKDRDKLIVLPTWGTTTMANSTIIEQQVLTTVQVINILINSSY